MIKNISKLEFKVGERTYQFLCDIDAPLEHAKLALGEFWRYMLSVENKAKEAAADHEEEKAESVDVQS